ncbi:uncharacterized protein J8A68_005220 [[Candida] subhashii]|uniref:Uncharacterized protein n=1 Tax=[Candida] subhashii TaxID=561895 RepID=A0A8J5QFT4_9ASCO|nr:uncharacterized protein J8A68_005220 [[Candida] subhashii]KAG7661224.1 hypothetical protein J8A68_005220 [[Candida] subhashii]
MIITRQSIGSKELTRSQMDDLIKDVVDIQIQLAEIPNQLINLNDDYETFKIESLMISHPINHIQDILIKKLQLPENIDWNLESPTHLQYYRYLRLLRVCFELEPETIEVLSLHSNPYLPWSNSTNSEIVKSIIRKHNIDSQSYVPEFISNVYKQNLKKLNTSENRAKAKSGGGLRPRLGYSRIKNELQFQERKDQWKHHPHSLTNAWFLIDCATLNSVWKGEFWLLTIAFILNLIDEGDIPAKVQACQILKRLVTRFSELDFNFNSIQNSGLIPELKEGLRKCLVHVPSITPVDESKAILSVAYPCIIDIELIYGTKLDLIDILNSHVLPSLGHLLNNRDYANTGVIIEILLKTLNRMIEELSIEVFLSMSKIMFTLNQIITDVGLLETTSTTAVLDALQCHHKIITQEYPKGLSEILFSYHFDFIGAWYIVQQRLKKYEMSNEPVATQIIENLEALKKLSKKCDKLEEYSSTISYIDKNIH